MIEQNFIRNKDNLKIAILQGWNTDFVKYKDDVLFIFDKYFELLQKELPDSGKINIYTHGKSNSLFCSYYYNDLYLFSVQAKQDTDWTINKDYVINLNDIVIYCLNNCLSINCDNEKEIQYICDVLINPDEYPSSIQDFVNKHYLNDKQKLFSLNCLYSLH